MIELKNLVKRYGDHVAVDHLNLTIEDGKIYGFLGPNGAGKSTTMNMMTGYLAPTEGEIIVNGHDVLDEAEEARACIGYLPELPPLYTDMTVKEYLDFCADLKRVPLQQQRGQIETVIHMTRLEEVQGRLIGNLSKGYRQRVGLAQAILGFPPIIILDEPTVGLDPKQIIEIRELIRTLAAEHTVILSSHILSEVQEVCDEIIIISHGRLVAEGSAEELEGRMRGENKLFLTVKGDADAAASVLTSVGGILNAQVSPGEEEGTVALHLETERDSDPREALFYALAEAHLPILELRLEKASLEQVFLELTESQPAPAPQEEKKFRFGGFLRKQQGGAPEALEEPSEALNWNEAPSAAPEAEGHTAEEAAPEDDAYTLYVDAPAEEPASEPSAALFDAQDTDAPDGQ